jgi:hypothetical protein
MRRNLRLAASDLKREIDDVRERFHKLGDDELFVTWFLRAFVTEDESLAVQALTGESCDKGTDAVFIDDDAKTAVIVQGKYRKKVGTGTEKRTDVTNFAQLAADITDDEAFASLRENLAPNTRDKLSTARNRIRQRGYRLQMYYVTTGKFSKPLREEALRIARRADAEVSLDLFDGKQVLLMLSDYLDGVAPPVPSLDLEMAEAQGVEVKEALRRVDRKTGIASWVFSMTAEAIAGLYEQAGPRLFARNVRGYLGSTQINRGMQETLKKEPEFFWYYNNGVTIICDEAERSTRGGRDVLTVRNPQVINGQQTTRTLHEATLNGRRASALVRVISVPREAEQNSGHFETLVSRIVAATNWQNAIRPSDLMSNDRRQVELERRFRNLGYYYLRKRQTKREARRQGFGRHQRFIQKETLAQAVAACDLDPWIVREGKEGLFEEQWYSQVFPKDDPHFYLPRYWLMRIVGFAAKGFPERAYAKWLVLNYLWQELAPLVRSKGSADNFRQQCERDGPSRKALTRAAHSVFKGAMQFYRTRRGAGAKAIDVSTFFKRKGLHTDFASFWRGSSNSHRPAFKTAWTRFADLFEEPSN